MIKLTVDDNENKTADKIGEFEDTDKSSSKNNATPSVPSDVPNQTYKHRIRSATKDENGKPTFITIFNICKYFEFGGSTGLENGKTEYIGSLLAYCNEPLDILTTDDDRVNELIKAAYEKRKRLIQRTTAISF